MGWQFGVYLEIRAYKHDWITVDIVVVRKILFFFFFFFYINRFARNFAERERERNLIYTGTYASVKIFLHPVDVPQSILLSLSIVIIFQHEQRIISKILESDEYKCRERGRDKNDMLRVNTISFRFSGTFYQYLSRIFSKDMIFKFNDSFSTRKSFFFLEQMCYLPKLSSTNYN